MIHHQLSGPLTRTAAAVSDEDVRAINSLSNPPPAPVEARDIYVRRCRLAGDAVDAYHGCFRSEDLPKLLALIQGAPLLVGHDKRSLGVARFFGGSVEEHEGHHYIAPRFYWLRGHSSAEDLRVALDGGLYNEASISFAYRKPTCSVCGEDVRTCAHVPGTRDKDGREVFYWYDDIAAVLEGSLVYRGAEPGTGFGLGWGHSGLSGIDSRRASLAGMTISDNSGLPGIGIPTLRVKRHGKWYQAPLVEENP